jgi:hypothetical protein
MTARRATAVAGLAFVVVDLAALLVGGPLPSIDDPAIAVVHFYARNGARLLAQGYLRGAAMALLVVFAERATTAFRSDDGSPPAATFRTCLSVVAAIELVRIAVVTPLALLPLHEETTRILHATGLILGAVIAFPIAAGTLALASKLRQGLPRWIAPAGAALAVAWLATAVRAVATNHILWTAGTVVTILWGLWLVALCADLWIRPGPESGRAQKLLYP